MIASIVVIGELKCQSNEDEDDDVSMRYKKVGGKKMMTSNGTACIHPPLMGVMTPPIQDKGRPPAKETNRLCGRRGKAFMMNDER